MSMQIRGWRAGMNGAPDVETKFICQADAGFSVYDVSKGSLEMPIENCESEWYATFNGLDDAREYALAKAGATEDIEEYLIGCDTGEDHDCQV